MEQRNKGVFKFSRVIVTSVIFVMVIATMTGCTSSEIGTHENPNLTNSEPPEDLNQADRGEEQPEPTATSGPTLTSTPDPEPVSYEGSGNQVIDIPEELSIAGIIHAVYKGSGKFVIWGYDLLGDTTDLFVDTIGAYDGKRLFHIPTDAEKYPTRQFSIETEGAWEITLYPFMEDYVALVNVPGEYNSTGDDVIVLQPPGESMTVSSSGEGHFIIWANHEGKRTLLLDEIAPYSGTLELPYNTVILEILTLSSYALDTSN